MHKPEWFSTPQHVKISSYHYYTPLSVHTRCEQTFPHRWWVCLFSLTHFSEKKEEILYYILKVYKSKVVSALTFLFPNKSTNQTFCIMIWLFSHYEYMTVFKLFCPIISTFVNIILLYLFVSRIYLFTCSALVFRYFSFSVMLFTSSNSLSDLWLLTHSNSQILFSCFVPYVEGCSWLYV